jgi:predicted secreted protein
VDITDTANTAKCTAVTGLSSNTVSFSTCNISVGVGATAYKVRITPKTHPNMPAVPGASYDTTGTVTDITCNNDKSLNDTGSATLTVDNASPAEVTGTSGTPGNQQVQLNWTNPGDGDFAGVVVLRRENTAVGDTPAEGNTYIVGNTIGSSTVACVESSPTATCTDTGLTNGIPHHYKIFTKDSRGNYNAGTVPTSSPFTPQLPIAISITTDGTVGFGYLGIGTSANSSGDIQTVQVDSGPADLDIKSTNFTEGVNTWTLNTTNGVNLVKWEFSKDGSSWTTFASPGPASYPFDTNVAQGQTRNIYLRITMPTETASYNQYSSTVTVMASAP